MADDATAELPVSSLEIPAWWTEAQYTTAEEIVRHRKASAAEIAEVLRLLDEQLDDHGRYQRRARERLRPLCMLFGAWAPLRGLGRLADGHNAQGGESLIMIRRVLADLHKQTLRDEASDGGSYPPSPSEAPDLFGDLDDEP